MEGGNHILLIKSIAKDACIQTSDGIKVSEILNGSKNKQEAIWTWIAKHRQRSWPHASTHDITISCIAWSHSEKKGGKWHYTLSYGSPSTAKSSSPHYYSKLKHPTSYFQALKQSRLPQTITNTKPQSTKKSDRSIGLKYIHKTTSSSQLIKDIALPT